MDAETKVKVISGLKWTSFETFAKQALQFVISIFIARKLMPSDYGVVGMLSIFMAISATFIDSGFSSALIQKKDATERDLSTAFLFNVIVASFFYIILFISAPWIADFYNQPLLVPITRIYTFNLVISAVCGIQGTVLTRALKFNVSSKLSIISVLVSGVLGIVMAYAGFGVWALVWPGIGTGIINIILLWRATRWWPKLIFSKTSFHALFGFGSKHLASSIINSIYSNVSTLVIGKFFQAKDLGLFTRAQSLAILPADVTRSVVVRVNYPVLSKLQDDDEKLLAAYSSILRGPMFLLYPVLAGIAALSYPLIDVLLGEKWLACHLMVTILAIGAMWKPLSSINLNLLYVKGRTDLVLKLELMKKPFAFAMLFAAIPFGIIGMCVSVAMYDFVAFLFNCHYTGKLLGYGFGRQIKELLPIIGYSTVMAGAVILSVSLISSSVLKLAIGIPLGIVVYFALAILFSDRTVKTIGAYIAPKFPKIGWLQKL
ncbi:MAG: lipopolysaccharide biosynthesis protein [Muribaculaceae bacterium]|nr:lipopolysaccharide biosynthesis protein [Muribaculaceae bacterium]